MPITIVDSSSDGKMTSARPSLLGVTVATGDFDPSLLSYHSSDGPVARGHSNLWPVAIVSDRSSVCHADDHVIGSRSPRHEVEGEVGNGSGGSPRSRDRDGGVWAC
jgi:hypothetical protein